MKVQPQNYYRLPWSLTDNAISWLEVTTDCNLACEGCYRDTRSVDGHKTLSELAAELDVFAAQRNSDCISIAGGDPLVHPEIVNIVGMIKQRKWKPILNTNGLALTPELLAELKDAGVYGFTFHIDTSQKRGDAIGAKTEVELNDLREKLASMLADAGDLACSFNQTVTTDTLAQVPDVMRWAQKHPDTVHSVVFILYREPRLIDDAFDYYANGKKMAVEQQYKRPEQWGGSGPVNAQMVVDKICEVDSDYSPCSYLGGSVDPKSTKWLLATRFANKKRGFGYMSPRVMELIQQGHHLLTGNWLAYSKPQTLGAGRSSLFAFSLLDGETRKSAWRFLKNAVSHPTELLQKAYTQSFLIIQPIDMLADGRADMCGGCPDMTVHNGQLYWSCRLEEIKEYGSFVTAVPKAKVAAEGVLGEGEKIVPLRARSPN